MNLFFWKRKKYDEELEIYLQQSQLYVYLQEGLNIIDSALSGETIFSHGTHIKKELDTCYIEFWYITDSCIRLKVYTKKRDLILEIESMEYSTYSRKYEFVLRLPVKNEGLVSLQIEKTKTYEEFYKKFLQLHNPKRFKKINENETKKALQKDAQSRRLQNLFK